MTDDEVRDRVAGAALAEHAADAPLARDDRRLALRLCDPSAVKVDAETFEPDRASVAAVFARALLLIDAQAAANAPPEPEAPRARGRRTPACPTPPAPADMGLIEPEEYMAMSDKQRLSEEVQRRVERSRHLWPDVVRASSFPRGD